MSRYKVYISSTYRDLKTHRQQVIEFFQKKTTKELFELISMEGYVADNIEPAVECLQDVEQCDIYLLILANRYGYIPPNRHLNPGQLSITELEYQTAQADPQKTILAFFADSADPQFQPDNDADSELLAEKRLKLKNFKAHVQQLRVTHPEPFISSYHLALQIAESLMRRSFIAFKLEESRKYCCDRVPQFTRYLQIRNKGRFKAVIIYGERSELGLNLINRFSIFTLSLSEMDIVPPLTFEEFLTSGIYEQCRTDLLTYLYFKLFNSDIEGASVTKFLATVKTLNKPLVVVIDCKVDMFEENQMNFLQRLSEELYLESAKETGPDIYFFLNLYDRQKGGNVDRKIKQFQSISSGLSRYLYVLPELEPLHEVFLRNWLLTYVTPDQGRVEDIMELSFNNLPEPLTMRAAEKSIHQFIQRVNNKDEGIFNIIN
jgi:hypothetical protein